MKRRILENKVLFVLLIVIVICAVVSVWGLVKYFYIGSSTNKYGDRLESIDEYKIVVDDKQNKIKELYTSDENVGDVNFRVQGKILYVSIDFKKAIKLKSAKTIASESLKAFTEEELSFYDIQFILTAKTLEDNNTFPTMGYKNAISDEIVWVNVNV